MAYRILSIDGGRSGAVDLFLSAVERRAAVVGTPFLAGVDLFAGTSIGAVTALLLAHYDDPLVALEAALRFDEEVCGRADGGGVFGVAGTLFGTRASLGQNEIKAFCADTFGEGKVLADLRRPALATAFQLDGPDPEAPRRWAPKLFTNLPGDPTGNELVVDVVLRTMAMPIQYPIHQSVTGIGPAYVDGGIYANNPAMMAAARALAAGKPIGDLAVLSVGRPRNVVGQADYLDPAMSDGCADWGYRQWILDPFSPLRLLDLVVQASVDAVNMQATQFLGDRFRRVEPAHYEGEFWDKPDDSLEIDATLAWLGTAGWKPASPAGTAAGTTAAAAI